jgi:hypothetical protein
VRLTARARRRAIALAVFLVLVAVWAFAGVVRAEAAARAWFAGAHGEGATVVNVEVAGVAPAVPPFWQVQISGDVVEAGRTTPSYRSYMSVWIEPLTGLGFASGSG